MSSQVSMTVHVLPGHVVEITSDLLYLKLEEPVEHKNKKVLLRERKRRTARCARSVPCADLSWRVGGGGGTKPGQEVPTLAGGTYLAMGDLPWLGTFLPWPGGTYPGWGVPILAGDIYPGWGYLPWLEGYLP